MAAHHTPLTLTSARQEVDSFLEEIETNMIFCFDDVGKQNKQTTN